MEEKWRPWIDVEWVVVVVIVEIPAAMVHVILDDRG